MYVIIFLSSEGDDGMERNALDDLEVWRRDPRRKPLLMYGARQVWKTYPVSYTHLDVYKRQCS